MMKTKADYRVWGKKKKNKTNSLQIVSHCTPWVTAADLDPTLHTRTQLGRWYSGLFNDRGTNSTTQSCTLGQCLPQHLTADCKMMTSQNRSDHFWLHRRHLFYTCMTHWLILCFCNLGATGTTLWHISALNTLPLQTNGISSFSVVSQKL